MIVKPDDSRRERKCGHLNGMPDGKPHLTQSGLPVYVCPDKSVMVYSDELKSMSRNQILSILLSILVNNDGCDSVWRIEPSRDTRLTIPTFSASSSQLAAKVFTIDRR